MTTPNDTATTAYDDNLPPPPSTPYRRMSIAFFFALSGLALANWTTRMPALKEHFGLNEADIGMLLFCPVIGSLTFTILANYLTSRFGSRRMTRLGAYMIVASLFCIGWAFSSGVLALSLVLFGSGMGLMNIAMNDQASTLERRYRRSIMSSFHGMFSLGMVVGGLLSGGLTYLGFAPDIHLTCVGVVLLIGALVSKRLLIHPPPRAERPRGALFVIPRGRLWMAGAIASATVFVEGSLTDWAAIFLRELGANSGFATLGVTTFAAAMTLGRLFGDRWLDRIGPERALQIGSIFSFCGLSFAILLGSPTMSLVGFALVGLGLSTLFPCLLSLARRNTQMTPSASIASVAMMGYVSLLAGPSLLGFLAHVVGVRVAFVALALSSVVILVMAKPASRQD